MAEFHFDNLARNLPDAYRKDRDSNNFKILEIERTANLVCRSELEWIASILDIDNADSATLDMYGEMYSQPRGKASDAQYRIMIKSKAVRTLCDGTYKSVIDAICYTLSCDAECIAITESKDEIMTVVVTITGNALDIINNAGFSPEQVCQIIKKMLPAAVKLETSSFEGTFGFGNDENNGEIEYDESAGFGEAVDSEIGGFLGWAGSQENSLPI